MIDVHELVTRLRQAVYMKILDEIGNMGFATSSNLRKLALVLACLGVSACVSDTLSEVDTTPQPLAAEKPPSYDPVQREQAVEEIRAKGLQESSGVKTNPYEEANGPNTPLTAQEQARKIAELQNTASQNEVSVTDAELAAKQRSIRELQKKAQSHYGNAINQIQN